MNTREVVLIVTAPQDETADAVIAHLRDRSCRVVRFDLGDFPSSLRLGARNDGDRWDGRLMIDSVPVEFDAVRSVYYRRPGRFAFPPGLSPGDAAFAMTEARLGFGGTFSSIPARWVNHPARVAVAEYKATQLTTAVDMGLRVPRTLITNDVAALRAFAAEVDQPVLCKTFSSLMVTEDGVPNSVFSTVIDPSAVEPREFEVTAQLVQEWVPKQFDVRVTMVGTRPYPAAIHARADSARVDWRADYDALSYEPIDTPTEITAALQRYMARFGLLYGAFDFVVDADGEWTFLECNSNGQWLWIQDETGLPIASALADLLVDGPSC